MQLYYAARGGRVTKLNGKVVSYAPTVCASVVVTAIALLSFSAPAIAQDASYTWGSQPLLSSFEKSSVIYQLQTDSDLDAVISNGAVTSTATGGASNPLATDLTATTVTASVTANRSTGTLGVQDLVGTGTASNGILSNALESLASDAYAAITNTDISNATTTPADGSMVGISDNRLTASVTLASSTNTLSGAISAGFANSDVGTSSLEPNAVTTSGNLASATGTAGLLLQSSQIASDVQATIGTTANSAFAEIGDANSSGSTISLTVTETGTAEKNVLRADSNRLSAEFMGNTASNLLSVTNSGMPVLNATAGLANMQVAQKVAVDGTTETDSATISANSGISATITGDLSTSSFEMTDNRLSAKSALNASTNTVLLADGISIDGNATFDASRTTVTASKATVATADLFVSNVQRSTDSRLSSEIDGTTGIKLTAEDSVTNVNVDATGNAIAATSAANDAVTRLLVLGANTLDGIVAQSNVQSLADATGDAAIAGVFASVTNGTISASIADSAGETVSGARIALSDNDVTAKSTANTADLATLLAGNVLSDGASGTKVPAVSLATASSTLQASYSSVNRQTVEGDSTKSTAIVSASLSNGGVNLTAGNITGATGNSSIEADLNTLSATAAANTATQTLQIDANVLDASAAVVNQQALSGGASAMNSGSQVTVDVQRSGSSSNLQVSADENIITAGVAGNTSTARLIVDATTMSPANLYSLGTDAAADPRKVLLLDGSETDKAAAYAGLTLLNLQATDPLSSSSITSSVSDADIWLAFGNGADTATGALSAIDLSVSSNRIGSMARANVAANEADIAVGSFDMSGALGGAAGGTNLAALGSSQVNTSSVTSMIDGEVGSAGSTDITATLDGKGATVANSAIAADANRVTSLASGNSTTNTLRISGTEIATPEADQTSKIAVDVGSASAATLTVSSTAIAVGNEQSNSGAITSTIANAANSGTLQVSAQIADATSITNTNVSADGNRVLAQAVAASGATTTTTIDATSVATTALVGSVQTNSGSVSARVGGSAGVLVLSEILDAATGSSVTSDSNIIAATATALTDSTSLSVGGANTASLSGAGGVTDNTVNVASGVMTVTADFAVAESQTNSGAVTTTLRNSTVASRTDDLTNSRSSVDRNLITAESTAATATTTLTGSATSMSSDAPQIAVGLNQTNTGAVMAEMTSNSLSLTSGDIASSDLSVAANSLRSAATALSATNTASLDAAAVMAGAGSLLVSTQTNGTGAVSAQMLNGTAIEIAATSVTASRVDLVDNSVQAAASGILATNVAGLEATSMSGSSAELQSTQTNGSSITARLDATRLSATTGATTGSVAMDRNTVRAGATGVTAVNLASLDGTSIATTSANLVSKQTDTGAISATVAQADLTVSAAAVTGSVSLSGNRTVAAATSILATNRVTVDAAANLSGISVGAVALADEGAYDATGTPVATLRSVQTSSGAVTSTIDDRSDAGATDILATLTGTVNGSVAVSGNLMVSQSRGNVADNGLSVDAGAAISNTTQAVLASSQTRSTGAINASVSGLNATDATKRSQIGAVSTAGTALNGGALSVDNNRVMASGLANLAVNTMDISGATIGAAALQTGATTNSTPQVTTGAQFAVLNAQTNGSAVNARVEAVDILANAGSGSLNGRVSLNGNMVVADATGNNSINTLRLAAAGGSSAPIAAVNYQSNSANMSASVDSVRLISAGGQTAGTSSLAGNSILATSTGNVASSTVVGAGGAVTSF